jgi:hypothetical protein
MGRTVVAALGRAQGFFTSRVALIRPLPMRSNRQLRSEHGDEDDSGSSAAPARQANGNDTGGSSVAIRCC